MIKKKYEKFEITRFRTSSFKNVFRPRYEIFKPYEFLKVLPYLVRVCNVFGFNSTLRMHWELSKYFFLQRSTTKYNKEFSVT